MSAASSSYKEYETSSISIPTSKPLWGIPNLLSGSSTAFHRHILKEFLYLLFYQHQEVLEYQKVEFFCRFVHFPVQKERKKKTKHSVCILSVSGRVGMEGGGRSMDKWNSPRHKCPFLKEGNFLQLRCQSLVGHTSVLHRTYCPTVNAKREDSSLFTRSC